MALDNSTWPLLDSAPNTAALILEIVQLPLTLLLLLLQIMKKNILVNKYVFILLYLIYFVHPKKPYTKNL